MQERMPYGVLFLFIIYMDPSTVFGLFEDPEDKSQDKVKELVDFKDHPYVYMGMFTRTVLRGDILSDQVLKFFSEINRELDRESLQNANKSLIYIRAYSYISQLDLSRSFHVETLLDKADHNFLTACSMSIDHFTQSEEYEKCSVLKKIKDFIEFSQKKLPL
jgi:hypothetical protein